MKAMLLAAGRGSRMQSLTDEKPKALLTIAGKPLIAYQLIKLANANIKDIVINVSYRAEQIIETLGNGYDYGVNIEYSFEPIALETGGGILQALPMLGSSPFIVLSADIWTDYPIEKLAQHLFLNSVQAHLVLVDNPNFHPKGDFHLQKNNFLSLDDLPKLTFASFGIYHPSLFKDYDAGSFPLVEVLRKRINEKKVTGEHYRGNWFNIGNLSELTRLNAYLNKQKS
ncbi:MAG: nucleotidyltransferase family protein [Rickettsiella sp.]|nr:nucleotidyltransferase family protein [Rickettsiella sp.]